MQPNPVERRGQVLKSQFKFSLLSTQLCRLPVSQHGAPDTPDKNCLNIAILLAILSALEGRTCVAPSFALCADP